MLKTYKTKTPKEIESMIEGGKLLKSVKNELKKAVTVGVSAEEIDKLAEKLILAVGAKPSFKMVPKYYWTTCVNIDDGIVHGIPKKEMIFKKDELISVDVGLFYKGFHTDTSFSVYLGQDKLKKSFLAAGQEALALAIKAARPGARIYDVSNTIETTLSKYKLTPVRALVGHGVGRDLHEEPQIPCFVHGKREDSPEILVGSTLAIEVMYTSGNGNLKLEDDGWTISTEDGKISALFEDTVAVTKNKTLVLTG